MVDSVQRTSTVPLQEFQTEKGAQNPLPLNAPKELNRVDDTVKQADSEKDRDGFEDYLNETSITLLQKAQENSRFDPADDVAAGSVYAQPNGKTPI